MEQALQFVIIGYLIVMSLTGFIIMGTDKRRAFKKLWRIPEKTLLLTACLGGGIGAFLGMYIFHHKTRHLKFVFILPLTALFYLVVFLKISGALKH